MEKHVSLDKLACRVASLLDNHDVGDVAFACRVQAHVNHMP